jgi:hypothetical protein
MSPEGFGFLRSGTEIAVNEFKLEMLNSGIVGVGLESGDGSKLRFTLLLLSLYNFYVKSAKDCLRGDVMMLGGAEHDFGMHDKELVADLSLGRFPEVKGEEWKA